MGNTFTDDKLMADKFNEFFVDIGKNMASVIKKSNNSNFKFKSNNSSLFLKPVDKNEIIQMFASLKNNAAPGPDGISNRLLKLIHEHLVAPLVHIIN